MDKITLIISLAVLVIISMDLSLSIILARRKVERWAQWNIVLCATLLGMCVFYTYNLVASVLYTGRVLTVMYAVFMAFFYASSAFLVVFVCRIINWLIARPMPRPSIVLTFINGLVYLGVSIAGAILKSDILMRLQTISVMLAVAYCFVVMARGYKNIENKLVKDFSLVFMILSLSVAPLLIGSTAYLPLRGIATVVTLLAYFIAYLCFMYIAIEKAEKRKERSTREPRVEDFAEFHITEREFDVILLIRKGMTNKEIGYELGISVNTVNNHIANIFQKTNVRSRIDLLNVLQEEVW